MTVRKGADGARAAAGLAEDAFERVVRSDLALVAWEDKIRERLVALAGDEIGGRRLSHCSELGHDPLDLRQR